MQNQRISGYIAELKCRQISSEYTIRISRLRDDYRNMQKYIGDSGNDILIQYFLIQNLIYVSDGIFGFIKKLFCKKGLPNEI